MRATIGRLLLWFIHAEHQRRRVMLVTVPTSPLPPPPRIVPARCAILRLRFGEQPCNDNAGETSPLAPPAPPPFRSVAATRRQHGAK